MNTAVSYDVTNCTIIRGGAAEYGKTVKVRGGKIAAIENRPGGSGPSVTSYDAEGHWLVPGFVELHIHGCGDLSLEQETPAGQMLHRMCRALAERGVNTFLPTLQANEAAVARLGGAPAVRTISRHSVVNEMPVVLHVPYDNAVTIRSLEDETEFCVIRAANDKSFTPRFLGETDVRRVTLGSGLTVEETKRELRIAADDDIAPLSEMTFGEVLNYPGKWSSYPPPPSSPSRDLPLPFRTGQRVWLC
jgi:hypothetical protein